MRKTFENRWFLLDLDEHWSEWFTGAYNWRNFSLIELSYEDECHMGNREVVAALLGFRARITWVYDDGAEGRQIVNERFNDILNHPEKFRPLDEVLAELKSDRQPSQSSASEP